MTSWGLNEEMVMAPLVGDGARKGTTVVGRFGDFTKRPPMWAAFALALALSGSKGRNAAVRGGVGYVSGALIQLPVGVVVHRRRPEGAARLARLGPVTSSFPSGHCASELGFSLGAAQEIPWLFAPLYAATLAAEWALVRSRAHYPSDIFGGAAIAIVVALAMSKAWPPHRSRPGLGDADGLRHTC